MMIVYLIVSFAEQVNIPMVSEINLKMTLFSLFVRAHTARREKPTDR
jgi:hypothetical protein